MVVVVLVPSSPSRRRTKPASVAYPQISLGEAEAEPDLQLPSPLLQVDEGRPLTPLFGTGPRPSSTVAPQALQPSSMAILEEISANEIFSGILEIDKNCNGIQTVSSSSTPFPTDANKEMGGERQPPAGAAVTVSKVLDDDDLLIEILLRVGFPTTLVCAALVCKRWLGHASDRAFLRRFRELHPPRLLGFTPRRPQQSPYPSVVPVLPQPPELAVVVRRASFKLETNNARSATIQDCQNGSIFFTLYNGRSGNSARVHCLLCPERDLSNLPQLPRPGLERNCTFKQVLSKEEGDGMSYYYLYVESSRRAETESILHVYMLQDGSRWTHHLLDIDNFPEPRWKLKAVLVDNKIYMAAAESAIIVLDLSDLSLSTIRLPQGVAHGVTGTTMLARAHDASGVYLIHVEEFQLRIWLYKGGNWSLVDTFFLREMCANLRNSCCTIEDE
uniref:F-box protein AT5G49610-like beta-propeller domain-containing protein n=1 Tax=Aegilops tauschii TaxID=37682 RepID=M8AV38_AEGTA